MSSALTGWMVLLLGFCILTEALREICFRRAAKNTAVLEALMKPLTWLGVCFWGMELVAWTLVLERVPLSVAFPIMALTYVAVVGAAAVALEETIDVRHAVGAFLITAGVACVGATGL